MKNPKIIKTSFKKGCSKGGDRILNFTLNIGPGWKKLVNDGQFSDKQCLGPPLQLISWHTPVFISILFLLPTI